VSGVVGGGFLVDDDGCLACSAVVEDDDFGPDDHLPAVEMQLTVSSQTISGRGQWKKKPSKPFGGLDWDWEECQ